MECQRQYRFKTILQLYRAGNGCSPWRRSIGGGNAMANCVIPTRAELMIQADAGGYNGHRPRWWKRELQQWADRTGLKVTVCHYPTGASKWNPIEHRLFSQISRNRVGTPLRSSGKMPGLIRGTRTTKGLTVDAQWDPTEYPKGINVTDREMQLLNLTRKKLCQNLNNTINPTTSGSS